jgi:hypothetical protein
MDADLVVMPLSLGPRGGTPRSLALRFTGVFIRRDGRWLVVAAHATRLDP